MTHTCTHIYDNGGICKSAAVTGQKFCAPHVRFRARQLRLAQVRARNERFDLKLPPLEDMPTVVSALNHVVEAVAAELLDLKRTDFLLKSLRFAAQALKNSDKWLIDVLTRTLDGRLAILELKADEDIHLPLQGLDYRARVRYHQNEGGFVRHGYFAGRELSAAHLLYLVLSSRSPATDSLLRYLSPQIG